MKDLSIAQFIVIDSGVSIDELYIRSYDHDDVDQYAYTNTGNHIYPIGIYLPVIKRGYGCIGMGIIRTIIMTETSTRIEFKYTNKIDRHEAQAYYSLYRGQVSMSADSSKDIYEASEDMMIPGAMATMGIKPNIGTGKKKRKSPNYATHSEINSILRPDFDDDDDDYRY